MLRLASLIFCAIRRRTPSTLISSVASAPFTSGVPRPAGNCACRPPRSIWRATKESKSSRTMRPFGPEPRTCDRSIPASCARLRIAGEVATRPSRSADPLPELAPLADRGALAPERVAWGAGALGAERAAAGTGALAAVCACPPSSVSNTMSSEPTGTDSPGLPVVETTLPLTGEGTSTAALSVITSTMTSSSATTSPGFTRQATISAWTVPSPRSGSLNTCRLIEALRRSRPASRPAEPRRSAAARENIPIQRHAGTAYPNP